MVNVHGLSEVRVPEARSIEMNGEEAEVTAPVFMSSEFHWPDADQYQKNSEKTALVLIQGSGAVRAGIWSRGVCIGSGLKLGSMMPQVDWALANNYSVIVMNPNQSSYQNKPVPHSGSMEDHCKHIWRNYIEPSGFQKILIIAHSAGGACVTALM